MSAGGGLTGGERRPMMPAVELRLAVPLAIFAFTYFVFAVGNFPGLKLDRTGAALAGAMLMVVTGSLSESQALAAFVINDVVCLSRARPLIEVALILEIDAAPRLRALATGSNICSVATIT